MTVRFLLLVFALNFAWFMANSCSQAEPEADPYGVLQPMPAKSDFFEVAFRDVHYWTEGDSLFCIAGLVDNKRPEWQKIWIRVRLLDAANEPVTIKGKDELVLRAFSEAIPPYGASSFFYTLPLNRLSARPDSCQLEGAAAQIMPEGPILVVGAQSNVKAFVGADTLPNGEQKEAGWLISCDMENPLPMPAQHPRLNVLIYGRDQKLWFSQVLNPEDTLANMVQLTPPLPVPAAGKSSAYFQITYAGLPAQLQETRIGRVEVLLFDAREPVNKLDPEGKAE